MRPTVEIGLLIERRPDLRRGRPVLAGTGVSVHRVVGWYKLGKSPAEIADNFGHVSLAQVHAALAYYHTNRDEIEKYLREEEEESEQLEEPDDRAESTIHPEVKKITGIVPADLDARTLYLEYLRERHSRD